MTAPALTIAAADALVRSWCASRTEALDRAATARDRGKWIAADMYTGDARKAAAAAHTAWLIGSVAREERAA